MSREEIEKLYITLPQIMRDTGQDRTTVRNWIKYHQFMPCETVLDRPVVRRELYEEFKRDHPELIKAPTTA